MSFSAVHLATHVLRANSGREHPLIFQHFVHCRSLRRINFQHATDYMTTLSGQYPEEPPRPLDDFLFVATGRPTLFIRMVFRGLVMVRVTVLRLRLASLLCFRSHRLRHFRSSSWFRVWHWRSWSGWGDKELVRVVHDPWLLPREPAQRHTAENDGQGPNVGCGRVIFTLVINLGGEVGIGANDTCFLSVRSFPK